MSLPEQPPHSPTDRSSRGPLRRPIVAGVLVVVIAASGGAALAHVAWPGGSSALSSAGVRGGQGSRDGLGGLVPSQAGGGSTVTPSGSGTSTASQATTAAAARVDRGLVDINTTLADDQGAAAGTGIVVTSSGEVITNNHVISGATRITATDIGSGKTYTAHVVGYDRTDDVAVLALVGASGLTTAPLGDSSTVRVGAGVLTIGNAGGAGGTPSTAGGSVVALKQSITAGDDVTGSSEQLTGLIEVNNDLQPGDSGGPLVDSAGNVVGMDTAASSSFSFQTSADQGFAIPIDKVLAIAKRIVAGDASSSLHIGASAMLGVLISPTTGESQGGYGYDPNEGSASAAGVSVEQAVPGSPAAAAGLTAGDTITAVNGNSVTSEQTLSALIGRHHPGDRVALTWLEPSGTSHTATLKLATGPAA